MSDAAAELVEFLRTENLERAKAQHQVLVLAGAVAAASASIGADRLRNEPELLALLSLLFVGFWLTILRHDLDIQFNLEFIVSNDTLGAHKAIQAAYEAFRFMDMAGTPWKWMVSSLTTVGLYGVPVLGSIVFGIAALQSKHTAIAVGLLLIALLMFLAAAVISAISVRLYIKLGRAAVALGT